MSEKNTYKITQTFIVNLKNNKGKDKTYHDSEVRGFQLRVSPKGKKTFRFRSSKMGENSKRISEKIGYHPEMSADDARDKAIEISQRLKRGEDPSGVQGNSNMKIAELCVKYVEYGVGHKKESTNNNDARRIRRHIVPLLGEKSLLDLTTFDVTKMAKDIEVKKTTIQSTAEPKDTAIGGAQAARSCVAVLSAMLTFAVNNNWVKENVAVGAIKQPIKRRDGFLDKEQLGNVGSIISKFLKEFHAYPIFYLLLLTGLRKTEVSSLKWDDVDYDNQCLKLRDSKTGPRDAIVGKLALDFIETLPRIGNTGYIFPNRKNNGFYVGERKHWDKIRKELSISYCIHHSRHTFATIAISLGYSETIIRALLGHSKGKETVFTYAKPDDDVLKNAADHISQEMANMLSAKLKTKSKLKFQLQSLNIDGVAAN